jgi:hypothetical protein
MGVRVLSPFGAGWVVVFRLGPLQQSQGKAKIAVNPGADGHGAARVVKVFKAVPLKNILIRLTSVAGQASGHAIFGHAHASTTQGEDMVDGLRRFAAINAAFSSMEMNRLTPASSSQLGTEIFKENRIPAVHPNTSAVGILT